LAQEGIEIEVVKLWSIAPLNTTLVQQSLQRTGRLLVLEECVSTGCVGQALVADLAAQGCCPKAVRLMNLGDRFVTHGSVPQLYEMLGIDGKSVANTAKELVQREKGTT
jgi:1-deoxy-D-xylulose-5-phosphate synthase